jgi:phosphoserine phosphatase
VNLIAQGPSITAAQADELARLAGTIRVDQIAERAFRLRNSAFADSIPAWCEARRIDYAFIAQGRRFADLKLLAMDMDSTLITIECIDELGDLAGKKAEIAAVTAQAMRGEIAYP